jgi:hypothetical protein
MQATEHLAAVEGEEEVEEAIAAAHDKVGWCRLNL